MEYSRAKHRVSAFKISLGDLQYCLDNQVKRVRIVRPIVIMFSKQGGLNTTRKKRDDQFGGLIQPERNVWNEELTIKYGIPHFTFQIN